MASPISAIVDDVKNKRKSVLLCVNESLKKAEDKKDYNALISIFTDEARKKAKVLDERIANNEAIGPLTGVTFVAKDNFLTLDGDTTAASQILSNFKAPIEATVITKLEAAGAVCIGKANLDSFGHGGSTENSAYGPTKNAHDLSRVAGGSSGGSAVAVALDIVPFALGTDTGGSIRQPSGFNGVVGIKPTYGAVSRFGVIAMASSFDTIGPIAQTAGDAELILGIMAGLDERDSNTLPDFFTPQDKPLPPQTIGIIKEFIGDAVDEGVSARLQEYIMKLQAAGHVVKEVSIPTIDYSLAMYYIIMPAEVMSNLSRYDGVRYGKRKSNQTLAELYGQSRDQGFEAENERRILIGSYVLSSGYYDAYYNNASKGRSLLINDFAKAFENYDLLISPVSPGPAFKLGEKANDPIKMYLTDAMTVAANLANLPAISVPGGVTNEGLPVGIQLMGPPQSDALLLALARSVEEVTRG